MDIRLGRQDPTVSVIKSYRDSKGGEAIEIYRKAGEDLYSWQQALDYDIMALDEEGLWTHQKFGYSIPRRNGKSENLLSRCLWGLMHGEKILYTAHRTSTSHAIWERLFRLCENADLPIKSKYRAMGKEHIYIRNGGRIEFRTRTSTGGLGEGYDLLIIDEAQEYTIDQETALKYVVSDSANPQTIMIGTPPTAISAGTVFTKYRDHTLQGKSFDSGWAEWSVAKMTDPKDVEAWYETNPSLGYHLKERSIRAEIGDDEVDFNIQRLGLWLKYNQKSAISKTEWEAMRARKLPKLTSPLYAGVKFGHDGANICMSIAAKTASGNIFLETIDCKPARDGVAWIVDFIRSADVASVVADGAGAGILSDAAKKAKARPRPVTASTAEVVRAAMLFEQSIEAGKIRHMGQPSVVQIVSNCEHRNIGTKGGFGYQSQKEGADVAILDSLVLAHWQCLEAKEKKKQHISY